MEFDIVQLVALARKAGAAIMEVYGVDHPVTLKADESPLTLADRASHEIIAQGLHRLAADIPILSEEGQQAAYAERQAWERFWLVDPLDGTKEFIKRNGEFTVNIALIENGEPVVGVIYVPVQDKSYFAIRGQGAWLQVGSGPVESIRVRPVSDNQGLTVVVSRSHPSLELEAYLAELKIAKTISVGSSLKLCAVAEGLADIYPRLGPTMEWDTAAGQAIVEAAGGVVNTLAGKPLAYNKESLLNEYFVVSAI